MIILKDNYVVGLYSSDGLVMAERAYMAEKHSTDGYVVAANTADGHKAAMRVAPLQKTGGFGCRASYDFGVTFNPIESSKNASAPSVSGGTSATRSMTWNYFPERTKWALNNDDIVVVSTQPIQFGTLGTYSVVAQDGFVLAFQSGFINAVGGQTLRVNLGTRSIVQVMDHDIYPAEWSNICTAAGVRILQHNDVYDVGHMVGESEMDIYPLQTLTLYVGILAVGFGFMNVTVTYASNELPTY